MITNIDYFVEQLKRALNEEYQMRLAHLAKGNSKEYSDYREWVGFFRGLEVADDLVTEAKNKADQATTI